VIEWLSVKRFSCSQVARGQVLQSLRSKTGRHTLNFYLKKVIIFIIKTKRRLTAPKSGGAGGGAAAAAAEPPPEL
jgi:hypothetical protein